MLKCAWHCQFSRSFSELVSMKQSKVVSVTVNSSFFSIYIKKKNTEEYKNQHMIIKQTNEQKENMSRHAFSGTQSLSMLFMKAQSRAFSSMMFCPIQDSKHVKKKPLGFALTRKKANFTWILRRNARSSKTVIKTLLWVNSSN